MADKKKESHQEKKVGMTVKKEADFSEWYQELILKSELADYSSVSGCIVFRPRSYSIWENVQRIVDCEFKKIGVQNAYFPLFIPESLLSKESTHVEGFTPEVAWVTQAGDSKLSEKLAIRPTSEAIMYESYSKWIRSWKDLPLRLNQWNNVVRWEFKHPVPFLRSREFLWNEGHHVYSNPEELDEDRVKILNIYQNFLKDYMALPSFMGKKTEKEKFAGAKATYTLELVLPNGKAIQGPDFHDDGQNFAKAYDIKFLDENSKEQYAYQATYAITTRMLGVMFGIHSDDKGLVVPPKMAENKIVIVPVLFEDSKKKVLKKAQEIEKMLKEFNPIFDRREDYSSGWKFHEWELKGIPLRIEIGPRDIEKDQVMIARRDTGEKQAVKIKDLPKKMPKLMEEMHDNLYKKAQKLLKESMEEAKTVEEMKKKIEEGKIVLVPFCNDEKCENDLKEKLGGAKSLNCPLDKKAKGKCINCKKPAEVMCWFGKSY